MLQILYGTYVHWTNISHFSEINIYPGILYFYLINLEVLPPRSSGGAWRYSEGLLLASGG